MIGDHTKFAGYKPFMKDTFSSKVISKKKLRGKSIGRFGNAAQYIEEVKKHNEPTSSNN
jgi:hypothetical protein